MKQEEMIEEFNKVPDIRYLLLHHPDGRMIVDSCLHYLGDRVQHWFSKTFDIEIRQSKDKTSNTVLFHEVSWKTVFNTAVADYYMWKDIGEASKAAEKCGYKYFTWNAMVYSVATGYALGITVNDLR